MLTEAEAWRVIGEAFEARAAHPELMREFVATDLAWDGLCRGVTRLAQRGEVDLATEARMGVEIWAAVDDQNNPGTLYLRPLSIKTEGSELRATLAYLFAEAAAA